MADCLSCPASELNNIVLDRDFKVIGTAQEQDADCGAWQTANTGFKIVPFTVQGSKQQQVCDISTDQPRSLVPGIYQ